MNGLPEKELVWPPTREDLWRLYVDERLSAAKIAQRYGLKYASPKTAESTILYHLKRVGISRRDSAEHIRKVTEQMVDDWVRRYQEGESLKQIAGGSIDPVTVFYHLRRRGLQLRDKVDAQIKVVTKHRRKPFDGDNSDVAYLLGFVLGDCSVVKHGRAVRVRTSTTHPSMTNLFQALFWKYGFVHRYPRETALTGFEWDLEVDLDASFQFLLDAKVSGRIQVPDDDEEFLSYLAGFFDAEGGIYLHEKRWGSSFEFYITNSQKDSLFPIYEKLQRLGYKPEIDMRKQVEDRLGGRNPGDLWRIRLWRHAEIHNLIRAIPSRHPEKLEKIAIASRFLNADKAVRRVIIGKWSTLIERFRKQRDLYVSAAKIVIDAKKTD